MKTRFIRINDISDINTSKITVYDFNNRYIDSRGNMYGLKYDRKSKKIDIIKLIRTPTKAAAYFHQVLIAKKRDDTPQKDYEDLDGNLNEDQNIKEIDTNIDNSEFIELDFHPDRTINDLIMLMQNHRERINGIMMNIKNSKVIPETDRVKTIKMENFYRNMETDGIHRIDKIIENNKELNNYPRSISYYLSKLDNRGKQIIDLLDSDTKKMNLIYYSEMFHSVRNLYRTLQKIFNDLNYFLDNQEPEETRDITHVEKQQFYDAKTSIINTLSEIDELLLENKKLEDFIYNIENF